MAEYLASIFGTEKDKVNCSFYFKIGACRHGDRCSRIHNKPTFSQTIVLQNLYINPQNSAKSADGSHLANVSDEEMQVAIYNRINAKTFDSIKKARFQNLSLLTSGHYF